MSRRLRLAGIGFCIGAIMSIGQTLAIAQEPTDTYAIPKLTFDEAVKAIQSDDPDVRLDGAKVLCSLGPKAAPAVDTIVKLLETHDMAAYRDLLFVLIELGPQAKPAVPVLQKGLESKNFHVRYLSCRALGHIGPAAKPAVEKLIALTNDPITSVRRRAAEALGNLGPEIAPEALAPLLRSAEEHRHVVRVQAILALAKFGKKAQSAVPLLERIVRNPKSSERAQAAWALYQITGDSKQPLMVLAEELHRIDQPWEAAEFLVRMAPKVPKAVEVLATGLQNPEPDVREVAAEALGKTGRLAVPMLNNLKQVTGDQNQDVRAAVQQAITAIERARNNKAADANSSSASDHAPSP